MDKKTLEDREREFTEKLSAPPYPVDGMLELMDGVPSSSGSS